MLERLPIATYSHDIYDKNIISNWKVGLIKIAGNESILFIQVKMLSSISSIRVKKKQNYMEIRYPNNKVKI